MKDVEGMRNLTDLMSQVGVTAFALMFAAVQIRWQAEPRGQRHADNLSSTRLGKLAAITALWELLTVTLVSVSFSAGSRDLTALSDFMWSLGWRAVALFCAATGYRLTAWHLRETRTQRALGRVATPSDKFQASWRFAPFASYGALMVVAVSPERNNYPVFAAVLVWLLLSGLIEVWVTLSPGMMEAEMKHTPSVLDIIPVTAAGTTSAPIKCIEFTPDQERPGSPTVVVLPDIWGPKNDVLALGDRICGEGYRVVIVDYYRGRSHPLRWVGAVRHASEKAVQIARDAETVQDWLWQFRGVDASLVALSIGGGAAIAQKGQWQRIAAFYPSAVPDLLASLRRLDPTRVRMYLAENDDDALPRNERSQIIATLLAECPDISEDERSKMIEKLLAEIVTVRDLIKRELPTSVVLYPRTRHGYMGTGRSIPALLRVLCRRWLGPDPVAAREAERNLIAFLGGRPTTT